MDNSAATTTTPTPLDVDELVTAVPELAEVTPQLPKINSDRLSMLRRGSPLASPARQLADLQAIDLSHLDIPSQFNAALARDRWHPLKPGQLEIFQINIGKLCNMTCRHCHVDAGPDRTRENMDRATIDACLAALDRTEAHTVDITGGAPELNPHFRYLVDECARRGKHIIDRCNLTVLLLPGKDDLPEWMAERGVEVVCSLPHYRKRNTDTQRGDGTYAKSIRALKRLNEAGYGRGNSRQRLTLMTNPVGAFLAGNHERISETLCPNYQLRDRTRRLRLP